MSVQRISTITVVPVIGITACIINVIVLASIVRSGLWRKRMYMIYVNLVLCDLIHSGLFSLFFVSVLVSGKFIMCQVNMVLIITFYVTSVGTITFLSFDRLIALKRPFQVYSSFGKKLIITTLTVLWVLASINIALVCSGVVTRPLTNAYSALDRKNCVISRLFRKEYALTVCSLFIVAPTMANIIINIYIFKVAAKHHKQHSQKSTNNQTVLYKCKWNLKASKTTVRIVSANVLCTLPYVCIILLEASCNYCVPYKTLKPYYMFSLLSFLTTLANPLVYSLTNKELKRAAKKMLRESCCGYFYMGERQGENVVTKVSTDVFPTI